MGLEIGDVIDGKYEIVRLLGEGGMGAVYEGNNTRIHRRVAIKVLHGNVAENEEAITRFEREAQAAGRIGSEHIVEVLDLGDLPGGDRYMVMEFLEGEALNDRIAKGQMDPRVIGSLMVDMLEGLKAAHEAGIIHRDLKPDNVFLLSNKSGKADFVKIVDFGISKFNAVGGEFSMTRTGAVMGTPYYMAPEQAKGGKSVDHRVDLYAVGVILYQAVVGSVPFDAETFNELLFKIVLETPPRLEERVTGIDESFVNIVDKAMARDPEQRYQSAEEFQGALKDWLSGQQIPAGLTQMGGTPAMDKTALPAAGAQMGTQGAWANTGNDLEGVPVKKGPPVAIIGIAAAVLLAAGGGFVAMSGGGNEDAAAAAAQAQADEAKKADQEHEAAMAAIEAEKAKAEAEAAQAKAEAEKAKAEKTKADADAKAKAAALEEAAAAEKAAAAAPVRRAPVARPKAVARPKPAPKTAPAGSRPIRMDL